MQRYMVNRLLQGLVAICLLAVVVFILSRASGNPLDLLVPVDASPEVRERIAEKLGLNRSYPAQFYSFFAGLLRGDFGESMRYRLPTLDLFWDRFPNSLSLILPALILAFIVGVPLGVLAALHRGRWIDRLCEFVGVIGMAAPTFWLGLLFILVFAVHFQVLPSARMGGLRHYILPVSSLAFFLVAGIMRLTRSSMLEVLDSEYVKLARIKGIPERVVIFRHCLRNSLNATFSFAGVYFAILIGGAVVVETVFAWPGVGRLLYEGIMYRDYPLIQAQIILNGIFILIVNLLIDILYAYLNPRIRF
jgi:peptide/nickel transport system permease protein